MKKKLLNLCLIFMLLAFPFQEALSQNVNDLKADSIYTLTGEDLVRFIEENCTARDTVYIKDTIFLPPKSDMASISESDMASISESDISLLGENKLEDIEENSNEEKEDIGNLTFKETMTGFGEVLAMIVVAPFALGWEGWDRFFGEKCDCDGEMTKDEEAEEKERIQKEANKNWKKPKKKKSSKTKTKRIKLNTQKCGYD